MIKAIAEKALNRIVGGVVIFGAAVAIGIGSRILIPVRADGIVMIILLLAAMFTPPVLVLVSAYVFVRGCWFYAIAKGHSGIIGLVGLMPFLGWIVLCLLPDNEKHPDVEGFPVILRK